MYNTGHRVGLGCSKAIQFSGSVVIDFCQTGRGCYSHRAERNQMKARNGNTRIKAGRWEEADTLRFKGLHLLTPKLTLALNTHKENHLCIFL